MTSLSNYKSTTRRAYLLIGPPGTGKTVLATQFPKPYILELDNNLAGPAEYIKKNNLKLDAQFDIPHILDGKVVPRHQRWLRLCDLAARAMINPDIETIVIDSFTEMTNYAQDEVRRQQGLAIGEFTIEIPKDTKAKAPSNIDAPLRIQDWGGFGQLIRHFLVQIKSSGKTLVMTAHMTTDKDEMAGTTRYFVACPGQTREVVAGYFDEVWLLSKSEDKDKTKAEVRVSVIPETKSFSQLGLKTSGDIPNNSLVDFNKLKEVFAK